MSLVLRVRPVSILLTIPTQPVASQHQGHCLAVLCPLHQPLWLQAQTLMASRNRATSLRRQPVDQAQKALKDQPRAVLPHLAVLRARNQLRSHHQACHVGHYYQS